MGATLDYVKSCPPQVIAGVQINYHIPPDLDHIGVFELGDGLKLCRGPGETADDHRARAVAVARFMKLDAVKYFIKDVYGTLFTQPG